MCTQNITCAMFVTKKTQTRPLPMFSCCRRYRSSHPRAAQGGLAFHSIIVVSPQKDDGGVTERFQPATSFPLSLPSVLIATQPLAYRYIGTSHKAMRYSVLALQHLLNASNSYTLTSHMRHSPSFTCEMTPVSCRHTPTLPLLTCSTFLSNSSLELAFKLPPPPPPASRCTAGRCLAAAI